MTTHKIRRSSRRLGLLGGPNWSSSRAGLAVMWSACCSAWGAGAPYASRVERGAASRAWPVAWRIRLETGPRDPASADRGGHRAYPAALGRRSRAVQPISSPVPSDADLWPGELPFTAWRQHEAGILDLRVFDQEQWWVDRYQTPHLLTDMSALHVRRVIDMLESLAEYYYLMTVRRDLLQRLGDEMLGRVSTDIVAESAGATPLRDLTPQAWLEGSPLMRALRGRRSGPGGWASGTSAAP